MSADFVRLATRENSQLVCVRSLELNGSTRINSDTHSLAGGWRPEAALQESLGHASIVTTQRYGRLADSHVSAEAARIGERLVTKVITARIQRTS